MRSQLLSRKHLSRLFAGLALVVVWSLIIYGGNRLLNTRLLDRGQAAPVASSVALADETLSASTVQEGASSAVNAAVNDAVSPVVVATEAVMAAQPVAQLDPVQDAAAQQDAAGQEVAVVVNADQPPAPEQASTAVPAANDAATLAVVPNQQNVAWFASGSANRSVGDAFLHAGYFEEQAFVSLIRFDLTRVPRGAAIDEIVLHLTGLRADRLSPTQDATWSVQLLADNEDSFVRMDFQTVFNLPASVALLPSLRKADIGEGVLNEWVLGPAERAWIADQLLSGKTSILARISGPTSGDSSLFSWDSGVGALAGDNPPELYLRYGAVPATPPPLPTPRFIVATATPTPANVLTVAARAVEATAAAANPQDFVLMITPTPPAANVETAQAAAYLMGLPAIVESTPVPANAETVVAQSLYATAIALTTGTPTPIPSDAVTPIIIVPTPQPENAITAVAQIATATAERLIGTPTPLPYNAVMATLTPTPLLIGATPTPLNVATASFEIALATAIAQTTGTATPLPPNATVIVPTATPNTEATRVPLLVFLDQITPTVQPTPIPAPNTVPPELFGKIIFWSDRNGSDQLFALDPTNGRLAAVTQSWPYAVARAKENISPIEPWVSLTVRNDLQRIPQVFVFDSQYNVDRAQITAWAAQSYDPVWSPSGDRIAFVSVEPGNDEIFISRPDGSEMVRITQNDWEWDKHPTWSPDGTQLVFWSNRGSGRRQLWIMGADGSNPRLLLDSPYNDWNPIWVK